MRYVAICDGLADPIWAAGESEGEAYARLWKRVSQYLKDRQTETPRTANMTAEELADFFGAVIIDLSKEVGRIRE
jgi:2-methylisocitrate lyase-like PEP mutase family enzyme